MSQNDPIWKLAICPARIMFEVDPIEAGAREIVLTPPQSTRAVSPNCRGKGQLPCRLG